MPLQVLHYLLIVGGTLPLLPAANQLTYDWQRLEQAIDRHRQQVHWCGPLSAVRCLRLLGSPVEFAAAVDSDRLRDPRGTQIGEVLEMCRIHRPDARLVRLPNKQFSRLSVPCILIVNDRQHAMVLQRISRVRRTAEVWDPSDLRVKTLSLTALQQLWSGDAIVFRPFGWFGPLLGAVNALIALRLLARHTRGQS